MTDINLKALTERDICTKFIVPALESASWDIQTQVREEFFFTDGQVLVRGKTARRGARKRVDFLLYYKPNIPIAIIETKDNNHSLGDGMQQALGYTHSLDVPFVFSSNGDGFLFHNKLVKDGPVETTLGLDEFPSLNRSGRCGASRAVSLRLSKLLSVRTTSRMAATVVRDTNS